MLTLHVPPLPPSKQNKMNGENIIMKYFNTFVYLLRQTPYSNIGKKKLTSQLVEVSRSVKTVLSPQSLGVTR